jgi:hypothetical protein
MKNSLFHRSIQCFFWVFILFLSSHSLKAQTGTLSVQLFHNSSTTANSKVTFWINISNGWTQGVSNVTDVFVKNLATNVTTTPFGSPYSSYNQYQTIPVSYAAGSYELKVVVSTPNIKKTGNVSVTCIQNIWIGNKVYWENCFDMEPGVSQYSMKRTKATAGQAYSYTQSFNSLASGALGWVEMRKLNSNVNDSRVFLVLEPLANPRSFTPTDNLSHVEFLRDGSGNSQIKVRYKQTNGVYRDSILPSVAATDKVRFQRNANDTAIIQINSSLTRAFKFPSKITGALKITILGKQLNDQADEISTSYSYPSSNYPISTAFHATNSDNTNKGTITTRITPLTGFTAPYNYFVTASPMDDMKSIYKYLKDSIYTSGVDSTTFFRGSTSSTTLTSPLLPSGSYYANVFDSKGVRMFTNKQELMPAYVFGEQNRFENSYNEFLSTSPNSYITLNTYVNEEDRGSIIYTVKNTKAEQSFGVLLENSSIVGVTGSASYAQLRYGFYLINNQLATVVNGLAGTAVSAKMDVPIELVFADGTVTFRQDGTVLRTETLPATFSYKSGAYVKSWGVPISISAVNLKWRPYQITTKIDNNACGSTSPNLTISFSGFHGSTISSSNLVLKNITDAVPATFDASVANGEVYTAIPIGVYSLEGSITIGATTYSGIKRFIYVGSKLNWDPYTNIQPWTGNPLNSNTAIATSSVNLGNPAKAISTNILAPQTAGWVVFQPRITSGFPSQGRMSFSMSEGPLMGYPQGYNSSMPVCHYYGGVVITCKTVVSAGASQVVISPNYNFFSPFLIARTASNVVNFRQGDVTLLSVNNFHPGRWKPDVYSNIPNMGVADVVASFQCIQYSSTNYAKLKYDLDGYYHVMKNGKINFVFNQEYDTQSQLKFNIYNSNDVLMKTHLDYPNQQVTNGENYISLDVTGASTCIGVGMFYLEVINDKKEKFYLRFYNDYTLCYPQAEQSGGGLVTPP